MLDFNWFIDVEWVVEVDALCGGIYERKIPALEGLLEMAVDLATPR